MYRTSPLETLFGCITYDAKRRAYITREEIKHLQRVLTYRMATALEARSVRFADAKTATVADPLRRAQAGKVLHNSTHDALLDHILKASSALLVEIDSEIHEFARFDEICTRFTDHKSNAGGLRKYEVPHLRVLWIAKKQVKLTLLTERLGDLHDRLEQFLGRNNPDHPDPTLRRRAEHGLSDKYLIEHCRCAYRDIARFVKNVVGAPYPLSAIPRITYAWSYTAQCTHHSFESVENNERRMASLYGRYGVPLNRGDGDSGVSPSELITTLNIAYWTSERTVLQPIIGHEVAHQVLRLTYGRNMAPDRLSADHSSLGRMLRRISYRVEQHLEVNDEGEVPIKVSSLVTEIAADLLGAARYGLAFGYAWIIEMGLNDDLAHAFEDETGFLRRLPDVHNIEWAEIEREFLSTTDHMQVSRPAVYYRGRVLLYVLREAFSSKPGSCGDSFLSSMASWLDLQLDLCRGTDKVEQVADEMVASDLVDAVRQSGFIDDVKSWLRPADGDTVNGEFQDICLHSQSLPAGLTRLANSHTFKGKLRVSTTSPTNQWFNFPARRAFLHDVAWQIEWALQEGKSASPPLRPPVNKQLIRSFTMLAQHGLLIQCVPPQRRRSVNNTVCALSASEECKQAQALSKTNSLSDRDLSAVLGSAGHLTEVALERALFGDAGLWRLDLLNVRGGNKLFATMPTLNNDFDPVTARLPNGTIVRQHFHVAFDGTSVRAHGDGRSRNATEMRSRERSENMHYHPEENVDFQVVFGRYDAIVLCADTVEQRVELDHRILSRADSAGAEYVEHPLVSRQKRLLSWSPNRTEDEFTVLVTGKVLIATVLVAGQWEGLAVAMAAAVEKFLVKDKNPKTNELTAQVLLSDGWEDLVLLLYAVDADTNIGIAATQVCLLVNGLNELKCVSSTETIFSQKCNPSERWQKRFVLRARSPLLRNLLRSDYKDSFQYSSGVKDGHVTLSKAGDAVAAFLKLHSAADFRDRIETRIAWAQQFDEADTIKAAVQQNLDEFLNQSEPA